MKIGIRAIIFLVLITSSLYLAACSSEIDLLAEPEIAYGEVICEQCGMIVSEESQAAAYRLPTGQLRIFDDLGDMVLYHRLYCEAVLVFWVHDYQTGEWMHAPDALFVATDDLVTPMGHGIAAFKYKGGAEHLAIEHDAPIYSWNELLAEPLAELPRHVK